MKQKQNTKKNIEPVLFLSRDKNVNIIIVVIKCGDESMYYKQLNYATVESLNAYAMLSLNLLLFCLF